MESSYFMKIYKKRWKYRIIALCFCGLCVIGLLAFSFFKYQQNVNNPAIVKTAADYDEAVTKQKYINISADHIYDLKLEMKETTSRLGIKFGEKTTADFVAIKLDGKILAISLPISDYQKIMAQKKGPYLLKGTTTSFQDSDLDTLKDSLKESSGNKDISDEDLDAMVFTDYLNYSPPINSVSVYLMFAALIILVVAVIYIPVMYKNTKALKRLKDYSNGNLKEALDKIDSEVVLDDVYKTGPITITKSYIIAETQQIVLAMPLSELMWTYKNVVNQKAYGVVTVSKISNLVLVFSDGSEYKVSIYKNKQNIDEILKYVDEHCNRTIVGYSKELGDLFKKQPKEFIRQWKENRNV